MVPPADLAHLRSFLGLIGYYRRFLRDYASLCDPERSLESYNVRGDLEIYGVVEGSWIHPARIFGYAEYRATIIPTTCIEEGK